MKTFLRGALAAAAVCAAVLVLPAGEAQARDECGALSNGAATCTNQAYTSGIRYDVADGWNNGVAGNVALTVTGGAATMITTATTTGWASGIVVRTAPQTDSTTRTIDLTVGMGTNAVAIAQQTSSAQPLTGGSDNFGVLIHQRGTGADATTVTYGSGVTIGASGTPMRSHGTYLLQDSGDNSGTQTINSAATIYSMIHGLLMDARGSGNVAVTNSGAITTTQSGIRVLDWSHSPADATPSIGGDSRTTDTSTTVTNSGAITVSGDYNHGIHVVADGLGLYKVVHSGTGAANDINVSGNFGIGINIDAAWHRGAAATDLVEVESSGDIIASGRGGRGILVSTSASAADVGTVPVASSDHIKVVTTGGTITTAGSGGIGIMVTHDVTGATTAEITNAADISSTSYAIAMDTRSSGNATVANSGDLTVTGSPAPGATRLEVANQAQNQAGIIITDWSHNPAATPTPSIGGGNRTKDTVTKVTNSGAIVASNVGHGIRVDARGRGLYEVVHGVATEGTVEGSISVAGADNHGIYVDADYHAGEAKSLAVKVTSSAPITASGANGIGIYVKNMVVEGHTVRVDDEDVPDADRGGRLEIANSGNINAMNHGILASNGGNSGAVTVEHSGGAIASGRETGITAEIGTGAASTNPGDVRVDVTGGSVTGSATRREVAVHAHTWGTGSVRVNVGENATLNARNNVGAFAVLEDNPANAAGKIKIDQFGRISASGGVYALVTPASASGASRTAAQQPLIDITWTGRFATPAGEATVPQANGLSHALALDHEIAAAALLPRASGGAGIVAEVMSWRTASYHVATADMPTIADAAAADAILAATEPAAGATAEERAAQQANYDRKTAILAEIGEALSSEAYTIPGVNTATIDADDNDALSAAEIATWLGERDDRHTVMTHALQYAFTEEEAAVFEALVEGNNPKAALDALETALGGTLPDGYRDRVTAIAGYHNDGNIRIAVNGGAIDSPSDGVRALYAWPDGANGKIDLTVAQGATVVGTVAGIYVANAGTGSDGILNQHVTVNGTVTGGTDAAVHLAGGGRLTVGRTGQVLAGSSGRAVLVNDPGPAEITVNGLVRGGRGARAAIYLTGGGTVTVGLAGKVEANGAMRAIRGDPAPVATNVRVLLNRQNYVGRVNKRDAQAMFNERVAGGVTTPGGNVTFVQVGEDGMITGREPGTGVAVLSNGSLDVDGLPPPPPSDPKRPTGDPAPPPAGGSMPAPPPDRSGDTINCEDLRNTISDRRCGLYESLPSVLLAMNALPGYDDRLSAMRDANGGWALVEGSSGEWKAESATEPNVAYDLRHYGVRAGVELASGDRLRLGVSAHHRRATAKVDAAGEIELSGSGAGVNATFSQDGFYADAQAAVTWFDAEITSPRIVSESDGDGVSYAAALEAGKRVDVSDALSVTPRAALEWSDASLDAFTDSGVGGTDGTVSVESASALTGRVGVRVEAAPSGAEGVRLFGAVDVTHLLSQEAEARILNRSLKTTSEETGVRAGISASRSWGEGLSLRGAAHYAASGGDNAGFGGTLSFAMRF